MFRRRLRPAWSDEELKELYAQPHDHRGYGYGHGLRVEMTISLARWASMGCRMIADLSCGNAAIPLAIKVPGQLQFLGDYASGYQLQGPIEETVRRIPDVNLFILSETVEHLDDPEHVLRLIRVRTDKLVLSTPIGENDLGNPEHYWGWDQEAVAVMLRACDFQPIAHVDLLLPDTYSYQIWVCE